MCDPRKILLNVLADYADSNKWVDATFEYIKRISNTKVGDVGQDFIERLCLCKGLDICFPGTDGKRSRQSPWDVQIEQVKFELKTATEDINGNFQFNHVRYHRSYDALMCLGISPSDIYLGCWTKAQVTTGQAGTLVSMEKGANASYKLTKRSEQLRPISDFEELILDVVTDPNQ